MATLLTIEASARTARSHTRRLTRLFEDLWTARRPDDEWIRRDVGVEPPPHVDEAWIAAAFSSPASRTSEMRAALAASDEIVAEVERADLLVLGVPMYNFGMPAPLKAWIDQMVRVGRTFSFDAADPTDPYRPLLRDKTAVVLTSRGDRGYGPGGLLAHRNHLDPHLETVLRFVGVDRIETVAVESDEFADDQHRRSIEVAEEAVTELVERLGREIALRAPAKPLEQAQ